MTSPTPKDSAPSDVRRIELVAELMSALPDSGELPLPEEAARLSEAQALLSKVLNNDPALSQQGLPDTPR